MPTKSKGHRNIETVLKEHNQGKLKSSSGQKRTSRKQAIAIALSEARDAGLFRAAWPGGSKKVNAGGEQQLAKENPGIDRDEMGPFRPADFPVLFPATFVGLEG